MYKLGFLFIIFGLYAIIFPHGIVNKMTDSYKVPDLIQGWGIYSITLGAILLYKKELKIILLSCFIISIFWHINIGKNVSFTNHHIEAIIANIIAIIILLFLT